MSDISISRYLTSIYRKISKLYFIKMRSCDARVIISIALRLARTEEYRYFFDI